MATFPKEAEHVADSEPGMSRRDQRLHRIRPRAQGAPIPLSATQRLHWRTYISEQQGGLGQRLAQFSMRVLGPLDTELLRECVGRLVSRHESLRTRIVVREGDVFQEVDPPFEYSLKVVQVQDGSEEEARRVSEEFITETIDPSIGPLFAAKLLRVSAREHVLVLALEHSITDILSNDVLCRELWIMYRQGIRGHAFSLPNLPVQFADYAVFQEQTHAAWLRQHEDYWTRRLADAPRIRVSLDGRVEGLGRESTWRYLPIFEIPFGTELSNRLRDLARSERALLSLVAFTVYVAAMSRWLRQRDLVVRFISHGRYRQELQNMVGYLATGLHLRLEVADGDSFVSLLQRASSELRNAYEHYDHDRLVHFAPQCISELHFNWVTEQGLRVATGDGERNNGPDGDVRIEPFHVRPFWSRPYFMRFSDGSAGIVASALYQPEIFAPAAMEELAAYLRLFAAEFCRRPRDPIASI